MAWLTERTLPFWVFLIIVLLPVPFILVPIVAALRQCRLRRRAGASELDLPPSEKPDMQFKKDPCWVRACAFFTPSQPTQVPSRFQFAPRKDKRSPRRRWPGAAVGDDEPKTAAASDSKDSLPSTNTYHDHVNNLQRSSWMSLFKRMDCRGSQGSPDETRSNRKQPPHVSVVAGAQVLDEKEVVPGQARGHDMRWLDAPSAQLTPLTPLDLPWTPMSTIESIHLKGKTAGQSPRLPTHNLELQKPATKSVSPAERREKKRLESWLATSHGVVSPTSRSGNRSSAMRNSFLQTWTKVYYQYLGMSLPPSPTPPAPPPKSPLPQGLVSHPPNAVTTTAADPVKPTPTIHVSAPAPDVRPCAFNFMFSPQSQRSRSLQDSISSGAHSDGIGVATPWTARSSMVWSPARSRTYSPRSPQKSWLWTGKSPVWG